MQTRQQATAKVLQRVNERIGRARSCAVCGHTDWAVDSAVVNLSLSNNPHIGLVIGGAQMPTVPLVCKHCGNTHLLNLLVLGLTAEDIQFNE